VSFIFSVRLFKGKITSLGHGGLWARVHADNSLDCGCKACAKCLEEKKAVTLFIKSDWRGRYLPNQTVTVQRTMLNRAFAACLIFGVPIVFGFASLFVWNYFFNQTTGQIPAILCAVSAIFVGFIAVAIMDKIMRNKFPPRLCAPEAAEAYEASDDIREDNG
jgi:Positive regulator of sigma(E), RseC/MucC